jgi:hypothetical protein
MGRANDEQKNVPAGQNLLNTVKIPTTRDLQIGPEPGPEKSDFTDSYQRCNIFFVSTVASASFVSSRWA